MNQNTPQQAGASGGGTPDMIRPHQLVNLPFLSDADKLKYKNGLEKLWGTMETNPKDSDLYQKASSKIKEVSKDLMMRLAKSRNQSAQANRAQSSQQGQQQASQPQNQGQQNVQQQAAQPQQGQQATQPQAQQASQQAPGQQQSQPDQIQRPPSQQQQANPPQVQQTQPQQGQPPQTSESAPFQISQGAKQFLQTFKVFPPPNVQTNTKEYDEHRRKVLGTLQSCLITSEKFTAQSKEITAREQQAQQQGQQLPANVLQAREFAKSALSKARVEFENVKVINERNRKYWSAITAKPDGAQGQPDGSAATPASGMQQSGQTHQQQGQQMRQMPVNAQGGQFGGSTPMEGVQSTGGQNQMSPVNQVPMQNQNQNQQAAAMHTTQSQQGQMQMPQQQQQPQGMQGRPQPMPHQQQFPSQHGQTSQMGQQPGAPQALSHQAAMSAAARTYSEQQQRGTPTQSSSGQSFPQITQVPNQSAITAKMPISKQLNVPAPSPVAMGASRPTFGGPGNGPPGMMGQPAIQKPPGFILEGEGDRVLSKKKLDELVRQVTGGGDGDGLTADVEEVRFTFTCFCFLFHY